ncbi:ankyrin repeat domain-containing protein [Marinobacter hydrocarbonoclasticus]|uniref:ankyrin repeat domain-containing protein n=1 Tax=Marinobacter nauticus TaxID=2743 RepID=UPI001A901F76|nr:ankyrin repeat domain-containing protein [Marinobacter nauticus]MBN8238920.1 ankyrin repeat domain-containing protein [Marinobacter nauticus]
MVIKYFLSHKKVLTLCAGALVIALTLYPMFYRTWAFGSDAWGLSVIAILDPEEVPWSPSDFNSLAIRPAVAYWLLTNFDWPYERCGKAMTAMDGCSQPLVNFVGTTLDTHEPDSIMTRRGYGLLRHFAARGEPVNGYYNGLTPVHEAVLYANVDYLHALLELGADPNLPIDMQEKDYHGFNAFEFAVFLEARNPEMYQVIRVVLGGSE